MRAFAIAALATALVSPAWAVDVSEFQKMNDELAAQFAKADAAAISQMYSTDATVLPPGSDMVKGRENIEKLWKGAIDDASYSPTELQCEILRMAANKRMNSRAPSSLPPFLN
jgi:ketosteroid isomerase-like protein